MSDIVILDTNVLKNIAEGNSQAAAAMTRLLKSGTKVYIARAAYEELVTEAATPRLRVLYRALLRDLGISVAPKGPVGQKSSTPFNNTAFNDRGNLYADNIQHDEMIEKDNAARAKRGKGPKGHVGAMDEYGSSGQKPGDAFVAAEAFGVRGRLWTLDKALAKRAARAGVQISQESSIPSVQGGGTEDISGARKMLGLDPFEITSEAVAGGRSGSTTKPSATVVAAEVAVRSVAVEAPSRSGVGSEPVGRPGARGGGRGGTSRGGGSKGGAGGFGFGAVFAEVFFGNPDKRTFEQKVVDDKILDALKDVEKSINDRLANLKKDIAILQLRSDEGEKIYANVTVEIHEAANVNMIGKAILTGFKLGFSNISKHKSEDKILSEKGWATGADYKIKRKVDEYQYSFEVWVFTKSEMSTFRNLSDEYLTLRRRLRIPPYDEIIAEDAAFVRQEIVDTFGPAFGPGATPDVWFLDKSIE